MNKDWNYALMWDTTRRALEESANQGLEVTALNVLNGMIILEELEERRRKEREERKECEKLKSFQEWQKSAEKTAMEAAGKIREKQTMFDVKIEPYGAKAEGAKECE